MTPETDRPCDSSSRPPQASLQSRSSGNRVARSFEAEDADADDDNEGEASQPLFSQV